ncbi:MAG TPA: hypothetical protein VMK12_09265 [Anaeromyxobacteraceae bacterium]|nr:hypothetical protein [Anaeromyxobacteraceae bacterium]
MRLVTQPVMLTVLVMSAGTGCATARIVKSNVPGPHSERLVELACQRPDGCMVLARQTCHGDFEVVTEDDMNLAEDAEVMLVHCKDAAHDAHQ